MAQNGKLARGQYCSDPSEWYVAHQDDYATVSDRLAAVRARVMRAPVHVAADIISKAYDFAVLSIRTDLERHERAFTARHVGGKGLKETALMTVYGGHKKNWMRDTYEKVDWETVALAVRAHVRAGRHGTLLDVMVDNLKGVSHRKASFTLAMCGFTEYMCIDSNVGNWVDIPLEEEFDNSDAYFRACERVRDASPIDGASPFLIQWVTYDFMRGEHARHMAYFREVLDDVPTVDTLV